MITRSVKADENEKLHQINWYMNVGEKFATPHGKTRLYRPTTVLTFLARPESRRGTQEGPQSGKSGGHLSKSHLKIKVRMECLK